MRTTTTRLVVGALAGVAVSAPTALAQCPAADTYEDNDDCTAAVALTAGSYTNLTIQGVAAAGGEDADFYSVTVPAGEILQVDCLHSVATGDTDLYLYDAANPTCGDQLTYLVRGYTGSDDEQVVWPNATGAPATYIIEIDAWDNDTDFDCNDYSLNISTYPDPCANPTDDSLEENDSCGASVALASGAHAGLFVSDVDEDYYSVSVGAADILTVDVTYPAGAGADVDLELFSDAACTVSEAFSYSFAGAGLVEWTNTTGAAATIQLRVAVDTFSGTCNNYDLNVTTAPDPCQTLPDDSYEENDDCGNSVPLADGTYPGLFVSKADEDFYSVTVDDGATLDILAQHIAANGDVDIYLYDHNSPPCDTANYLARAFTGLDAEVLSYTNTTGAAVTYWVGIRVWDSSDSDCNEYDLTITGSGGGWATTTCPGDGSVTACPCGNESALGAGEGCNSSLGYGAMIAVTGSNSIATDDITFSIAQARPNQPSLLVQGSTAISVPFKDGVLCAGNPTERIEVVILDANGAGSTTASIVTEGNLVAGDTRNYQFWFRDPGGVSPCGSGSNFTSGLEVVYVP